ncbi:MAG: bifunctional phosphoribosylaminoimidazolecarboxamide formyltransferase/IMP cyclohydrolase, partial [Terriglobales bacterium]
LVDLDACWELVREFAAPAVAIIKHTNPAGCATGATLAAAYGKALACDPISAFGGVIGLNRPLDAEAAAEISKLFVECIAAPSFSAAALELLAPKKNLRLVEVHPATGTMDVVMRTISGGLLIQSADRGTLSGATVQVVTQRSPSAAEMEALEFGWRVCKHVKSNAIVFARDGQTVAVGAGQMSRVDSVKLAAMKAQLPLAGSVVASDAFFPFPDGVEEAATHGITALIQPGGSVRDNEVIATCDRLGLAMVFTGMRHFRH